MSSTPWMDSPHGSDWSTASQAGQGPSSSASRQLARVSETTKPTLSLLKQQVLTEDEYTEGVSDIIKRTFFPQLRELDAHNQLVAAFESEDPAAIEASVRRMREICTPTPRRRNKGATPGRTPFGTEPSSTPTYFSETPSSTSRATPRSHSTTSRTLRYDPTLSLSAFQSTYTSEDNSSFASLLAKDNLDRKEKSKWAWEAERRANVKANRNSLMFPPDANGPVALSSSSTTTNATDTDSDGLPLGEPKGIRYHATRLDHVEKRAPGAPSPSRSRIHAAISGTPCSSPPPSPPSHH
ncbi:hypothetical protein RQP46_003248 [Phenoliferia psychrophenolica]